VQGEVGYESRELSVSTRQLVRL